MGADFITAITKAIFGGGAPGLYPNGLVTPAVLFLYGRDGKWVEVSMTQHFN